MPWQAKLSVAHERVARNNETGRSQSVMSTCDCEDLVKARAKNNNTELGHRDMAMNRDKQTESHTGTHTDTDTQTHTHTSTPAAHAFDFGERINNGSHQHL